MELLKCFKALSDETRVRLFHILHQYELNVNEIVAVVDMIQSGVSRHLKILQESGLLNSRRDGSFTYYSASETALTSALFDLIAQRPDLESVRRGDLEKTREMIALRQDRTKRFFREVAPQWDRLKKEVLGAFDLDRIVLEQLSAQGSVSDLGCGTGELMLKMSAIKGRMLIGIDSSLEMLAQARQRLSGVGQAELRLGELEHLPMRNQEVDTAVMNMVLHHISQPDIPMIEVFRVLKPGGRFILSDFEKHDKEEIKQIMGGAWYGFEKDKINTWLIQAGFHPEKVMSYPVNHGLIINVFCAKK